MRWIASGPYAARRDDGSLRPDEEHLVHAKEIGTVLTACGTWAATWPKFWDVSFLDAGGLRRCPDCLDALIPPSGRPGPDGEEQVGP